MTERLKKAKLAAGSLLLTASGAAVAAVPAAATDAITTIQTDGLAIINAVWPVLAAITGGLVLMKLFKKAVSRAT